MSEKTTKDKKERTLSLKPGLVSSTNSKGSRSPRASTVVVESRRGRLSQTRKPVAPSVRVRKAPTAPNVFKPKTDNESLDKSTRNLTDSERDAREKALANAKIKKEAEKVSKKDKTLKKDKVKQNIPDIIDPANIPAKKDPELAKETRKNKLLEYADEEILVFGTHFATPSAGFVRKKDDHFIFEVQHPLEKR